MNGRKEDLSSRLVRLKSEVELSNKILALLLDDSTHMVNMLVTDMNAASFREKYPSSISELDDRLHHIVQFNCFVESSIDRSEDRKVLNSPERGQQDKPRPRVPTSDGMPVSTSEGKVLSATFCNERTEKSHPIRFARLGEESKAQSSMSFPHINTPPLDIEKPSYKKSAQLSNVSQTCEDSPIILLEPQSDMSWSQSAGKAVSPAASTAKDDFVRAASYSQPVASHLEELDGDVIGHPLDPIAGVLESTERKNSSDVKVSEELMESPKQDVDSLHSPQQHQTKVFYAKLKASSPMQTVDNGFPQTAGKAMSLSSPLYRPNKANLAPSKQVHNSALAPPTYQRPGNNHQSKWSGNRNPRAGRLSPNRPANHFQAPKQPLENLDHITKHPLGSDLVSKFSDELLAMLANANDWNGLVSHVVNPSEFYIHVAGGNNHVIDDFHQALGKFCANATTVYLTTKENARKQVGDFCVCYFRNDVQKVPECGWYRAQVLDWLGDSEQDIQVQLVDYGNKFTATLADIQPLAKRFATQPLFATRCHLSYLRPPRPRSQWPQTTATLFQKHLDIGSLEKSYMISPTDKEEIPPFCDTPDSRFNHDLSVPVILVEISGEHRESANDFLINVEFAEFDDDMYRHRSETQNSIRKVEEWCTDEKDTAKPWTKELRPVKPARETSPQFRIGSHSPLAASIASHNTAANRIGSSVDSHNSAANPNGSNSPEIDPTEALDPMDAWDPMREDFENPDFDDEDACVAVTGYAPQDELRVCRFFANDGHCPKGERCRREHVPGNIHGITTDKEQVFDAAFNEMPSWADGDHFQIQLTAAPRAKHFYAIIPGLSGDTSGETLETLCNAINAKANVAAYKRPKVTSALGEIVLALFSADRRWYRGRVVDALCAEGTVCIFFVDFGNWERVREANVRVIEPRFMHLPFQAMQCRLANVELVEETLHHAARFLWETLDCSILDACVIASDESVLHITVSDARGRDVGKMIAENGLGVLVDQDRVCRFKQVPGNILPG